VCAPVFQSDVGEALYRRAVKENLPLRAAVVWYVSEDGSIKASLRSAEGGADVSVMAKKRGGGGHLRAAGCRFSTYSDLIEGKMQSTSDERGPKRELKGQ